VTICIFKKKILAPLFALMCLPGGLWAQAPPQDSLRIYITAADERAAKGDWVLAATRYYAAQRLADAERDTAALCAIQIGLAKISASTENHEGQKQAIEQGQIYCAACKDSLNLGRILMSQGILFYKFQQFDSSAQCFSKSAELYLHIGDTLRSANALAKVGNVREEQGQYELANQYYRRFYDIAYQYPNKFHRLTANIYLGGNYLYLNRPQDALRHAMEARRLAQEQGMNHEYSVTLQYEADAYQKMGQHEKAFAALKRYANFYKDTLINAERTQQIETLKTQYETEKKEGQIALQTQELRQQRTTIWAGGTVLALVLLGGVLLFLLTRTLRRRNAEKEFLIKEIHHRVKNNLQVLSSLLHLQSRQITDETALDAVREGQNRVDAMGLIHQKLYMGDNLASVEMQDYLKNLGDTLLDSFGLHDERVSIVYAVETMHLDVDTAIPLGLIINELVTNSLKYAFPGGRAGQVEIALWRDEASKLSLRVSDNGLGKSAVPDPKFSTSFGTNLVQMLSKKLKGKIEVPEQAVGYSTAIRFEAG
jgi:two-component system, sensor histidine kinase PdtaS